MMMMMKINKNKSKILPVDILLAFGLDLIFFSLILNFDDNIITISISCYINQTKQKNNLKFCSKK
jgi:hypothetical protein